MKSELVERLSLQIMAERSVWRKEDPEFAAGAILRASAIHPGIVHMRNRLGAMEYEPVTPVYMSCWFYALAHELGHFKKADSSFLPTNLLLEMITKVLGEFDSLSEQLRSDAVARAAADEPGFILGVSSVRHECVADIFATAVMLQSTASIMAEISNPEHPFELLLFLSEMLISLNVIVIMSRCERISMVASATASAREILLENLLQPLLVQVRAHAVRGYLETAALRYLYGEESSDENRQTVSSAIDSLFERLRPDIAAVEKGMSAAITFALSREKRPNFFEEVLNWNEKERNPAVVEELLQLVKSRRLRSVHFDALLTKLEDPSADLSFDEEAAIYWCPLIVGPDNFARPFDLATRHGNVVFIFASQGPACTRFCEVSSEGMTEGYRVTPAMMLANSNDELKEAIVRKLPLDFPFQLVVEGTPEFEKYIGELSSGTIWS